MGLPPLIVKYIQFVHPQWEKNRKKSKLALYRGTFALHLLFAKVSPIFLEQAAAILNYCAGDESLQFLYLWMFIFSLDIPCSSRLYTSSRYTAVSCESMVLVRATSFISWFVKGVVQPAITLVLLLISGWLLFSALILWAGLASWSVEQTHQVPKPFRNLQSKVNRW